MIRAAPLCTWSLTASTISSRLWSVRTKGPQVPGKASQSPAARMRGPNTLPAATDSAKGMLMPPLEPTSLAEVMPERRARRALPTALRVATSGGSLARISPLSGPPSLVKCSWQSMMPGISVKPRPSTSSVCEWRAGCAASSPIQVMWPCSASTVTDGAGAAPVPSTSLTLRINKLIASSLYLTARL